MRRTSLILAIVVVAGLLTAGPAAAAEPKTALLIIDIQDFYFPGGKSPLVNPEAASANAAKILGDFRAAGDPVVHVRHEFEPGG